MYCETLMFEYSKYCLTTDIYKYNVKAATENKKTKCKIITFEYALEIHVFIFIP